MIVAPRQSEVPLTLAPLTFAALFSLSVPALAQEIGTRPDRPAEQKATEPLPITKAPSVLEFVEADYPEAAKTQGTEAAVGLAVEIGTEGQVLRVEVMRPAGQGFDEAAVAAVEAMRFSPAENAEGPVAVAIEFEYNFTLRADETAEALEPVNLEGTVVKMGARTPVAGASVAVVSEGLTYETTTDDDGYFALRAIPLGRASVTIDAPGHAQLTQSITVREGEVASARLWLRPNVSVNEAMVVSADRPEPDISRRSITVSEQRNHHIFEKR